MVVRMDDTFVGDHVAAAEAGSAAQRRQDIAAVSMAQHGAAGGRSLAVQGGLHHPQRHQDSVAHREALHSRPNSHRWLWKLCSR